MMEPFQTLILGGVAALALDVEGRLLDDPRDDLFEACRKLSWVDQMQDTLCGADERRKSDTLRAVAARIEIERGRAKPC